MNVINAGVQRLLASASHEVLVMGGALNNIRRVDHENLRRGVRYRVLVPDADRLLPQLGAFVLAGGDVRTLPQVPANAVVVDGAHAVLASDQTVAVFALTSVVTTTAELFERLWRTATPFTDRPHATGLTARERDLLVLLNIGCTDESAAARLDVSVRTVRRMVADLMNRLGARSRFQAGAKAADRGWLLEEAS
ncbi:hypothetical protein UK23_33215 [Lentzea aerocolonigenes]|uniref:HTH luxR-type domain-containing protein n=1 Tax=Lentzea aerocolonigenes TaxID=68170 RepID=A0A0F0GLL6_LENAE|nr:helix-turn-helix transcriptional regulator [Lentzea aerocolonigenes]KJK43431.1 hypothetical protein UK23_33215 [Lentzea aerocolonigenes]